jgi:hypothetical protein
MELPGAHQDAPVREVPFPLPVQRPTDAIPQAQPASDASDAVRPVAAADATVPAQADALSSGRLAGPELVFPVPDAMRPAPPEVESELCKPDADPSAA